MGLDQPGALALLPVDGGAAVVVAQLDAGAVGELLDRLGEGQVVDLLQEGDDVAALAAAEAVVHAPAGGDVEAGRALVVEGAQALEGAAAGGLAA